jgi:hypothetical protein
LYPARIERVRYLSQRSRPGVLDLPNERQDRGRVLIGSGFVCYRSLLYRSACHSSENISYTP